MAAKEKTVVTAISKLSDRRPARDACLVVIYGHELGKKFNLENPSTTIGRSSACDIQIDHESVSRNHARVETTGKTIAVRDLGSTNGTYVNDEVVDSSKELRDGDFVKIGRTIFKFLTGGNIENSYHEEIYRLTTIDGLTQIYNKRYFLETIDRELSRAVRYKRPLSLIMFDIDHFKKINDTHGHLAGDAVLAQMASLISGRIRREDVFARYGGEEFSLILPEIDRDQALVLAEKVRKLVEKGSFAFESTKIPVTISIGVAACTESEDSASLIKRADEFLYDAKHSGRNCTRG